MKKITLFILLCFLINSVNIFCQSDKLSLGETYKTTSQPLTINDNFYYLLESGKKGEIIKKYDLNHKFISEKRVSLNYGRKPNSYSQRIETKSGIYLFYPDLSNQGKQLDFQVSQFKDETLSPLKKVYQHPIDARIANELYGKIYNASRLNRDIPSVIEVSNKKNHVVYVSVVSGDDKDKEAFNIALFDEEMNLLWDKEQIFSYQDEELILVQASVDNNGKVYLLTRYFNEKQKVKSGNNKKYSYKVFEVTKDDIKEFNVNLGEKYFPVYASIHVSTINSQFAVLGFYDILNDDKSSEGIFYVTNNGDGELNNVSLTPFSNLEVQDVIKEGEKGLDYNYRIKTIMQFDDGTLGFIASERYIRTNDENSPLADRNLIIAKFTSKGEIETLKTILKDMNAAHVKILQPVVGIQNDKIYLVYNDRKKKPIKPDSKIYTFAETTDMTVLSSNGEIVNQDVIMEEKETGLLVNPVESIESNDKILLMFKKYKKVAVGILYLK